MSNKSFRKLLLVIAGITAFISFLAICSSIESPQFNTHSILVETIIFVVSILSIIIIDRPSRITKWSIARRVCILAWAYGHGFTNSPKARKCALLKNRYHTYKRLYSYVIRWVDENSDDEYGVFY